MFIDISAGSQQGCTADNRGASADRHQPVRRARDGQYTGERPGMTMIENRIRTSQQAGKPVINGWLSMGNAFAAEVLAEQGFDSLTVDMQHGLNELGNAVAMFQAIRASGVVPVARVPWLEPGIVMKALDVGALAIICPMINNREQSERFVSYMRYPPGGVRSFGPTRAAISAGPDYAREANRQVMSLAMIETLEAYDNIDDIVTTPGLDGIYIGPADLTIGLTNGRLAPGFDREEEELVAAIRRILDAAKQAGLVAGLHCGAPEYAAKAIGWGFDLVTVSTDARLLAEIAARKVARVRALVSGNDEETTDTATNSSY